MILFLRPIKIRSIKFAQGFCAYMYTVKQAQVTANECDLVLLHISVETILNLLSTLQSILRPSVHPFLVQQRVIFYALVVFLHAPQLGCVWPHLHVVANQGVVYLRECRLSQCALPVRLSSSTQCHCHCYTQVLTAIYSIT